MKNKTANKLLKILRMLISPDDEIRNLGASLFSDCYLVKQLNKYEKFDIESKWPGFSDTIPHYLNVYGSFRKSKFTKNQFIKMLNSKHITSIIKSLYIFNFIHKTITKNDRNCNRELDNKLFWEGKLDGDIISKIKTKTSKYEKYYYRLNSNKEIILNKQYDEINNFSEDIQKLRKIIKMDKIEWTNITPIDYIKIYNFNLRMRYKNKNNIKQLPTFV